MIYGMKPFNSAEMREYLNILSEDQIGQEPAINPDASSIGQEPAIEPTVDIHEDFPGTQGEWVHGGFKVRYNPSTQTVVVQGKNQERSHKFTTPPTDRSYRDRVQQIIDRLEDESELEESRTDSLVMREWMAICR